MTINVTLIKPGDVLYDVHRVKIGNTTNTRLAWFPVVIQELVPNGAMASWNGNPPRLYAWSQLRRLRRSIPKKLRA